MYNQYTQQTGQSVPVRFDAQAPFADPFADLASRAMPLSVPAMYRHAEFIAVSNETLRSAFNRVAAYFVTDVVVEGELGSDEKEHQRDYLIEQARVVEFLVETGLSFLVYGNAYTSVFMPFVRYLACPGCQSQYAYSEFSTQDKYAFRWRRGFHGRCPACDYTGDFGKPVDVPDESRPVILHSWNPHDIRVVPGPFGRPLAFHWVIPQEVRSRILQGENKLILGETPWEVVRAVLDDKNLQYKPDLIHHWREPALSGLRFDGVGVPRAIVNYRQVYHAQILRRMNEALALGHVVPMRVISPGQSSGRSPEEGDILKTSYLGDLRSRVTQMIANHRADPSSVHFSPVPLQMQSLGADARQLIPADVLNQSLETLLNGCDMPVEFYRASMATTNAPVGLRLINQMWAPFVGGLNSVLGFIGRRTQRLLGWEKAKHSLKPVTVVDAIERIQILVQMAQAGLLSRSSALEVVDRDFVEELRRKNEEQLTETVEQAKFQKKVDTFAFGQQLAEAMPQPGAPPVQAGQPGTDPAMASQGAPAGGAPPQPGAPVDPTAQLQQLVPQGNQKMDPTELVGRAQAMADQLLSLPESQRYGILQNIKEMNPVFHALTKSKMEERRSSARSQGQQMVLQSQFGGGGQ